MSGIWHQLLLKYPLLETQTNKFNVNLILNLKLQPGTARSWLKFFQYIDIGMPSRHFLHSLPLHEIPHHAGA
jgi:hypothetical protein